MKTIESLKKWAKIMLPVLVVISALITELNLIMGYTPREIIRDIVSVFALIVVVISFCVAEETQNIYHKMINLIVPVTTFIFSVSVTSMHEGRIVWLFVVMALLILILNVLYILQIIELIKRKKEMGEKIFSAEFGKLVKLEDYGLNNSEFFQIDIGNNKYGRVLVTILVGEKSSFYLRFFNKKIEEIRRQYWGIAPIDFPSEPWWYAAGPRLFERTEKEALKKAVDVLKENEEEPMSDEVKYYFKRTLRIFEFLLSNEGQKFIKENNIHRYNYQPGDIEEHKKIEKAIEEVYEQLNAILNQKEVWDEKDLGTV